MQHFGTSVQRLMLALLVGVVAVPVTSTAVFIKQQVLNDAGISGKDLMQKAVEDRRRLRDQRRLYWQAIDAFQQKSQEGIDVTKPDINNVDSINAALYAKKTEDTATHDAAPTVSSLTTDQLSIQDRGLLRRYTRAGFCPDALKGFEIPGFYDLCIAIVGSSVKKEPVTGLLNHNAYLNRIFRAVHQAAPADTPKFKLRMLMIDQANDPATRRDSTVLPGRPTTCTMNPDCLAPKSDQ